MRADTIARQADSGTATAGADLNSITVVLNWMSGLKEKKRKEHT